MQGGWRDEAEQGADICASNGSKGAGAGAPAREIPTSAACDRWRQRSASGPGRPVPLPHTATVTARSLFTTAIRQALGARTMECSAIGRGGGWGSGGWQVGPRGIDFRGTTAGPYEVHERGRGGFWFWRAVAGPRAGLFRPSRCAVGRGRTRYVLSGTEQGRVRWLAPCCRRGGDSLLATYSGA